MKIFLSVFVYYYIATFCFCNEVSEITTSMKDNRIIPEVIDEGPRDILKITYEGGKIVNKGNQLTPTEVKNPPQVEWNAENDTFYTLIMTDPDAPSRTEPKFREWHHWLIGNIPGNRVNSGIVLSEYIGAAPPKGTSLHRYIFLLFKQPDKIEFDEPLLTNKNANNRGNFSTKKFSKKYNLGAPIAGNFFQAKWDRYVPKVYAQLGF